MVRNKVWPEDEKESGLDGLIRELSGSTSPHSGKAGSA
jgi:hypothetical protein